MFASQGFRIKVEKNILLLIQYHISVLTDLKSILSYVDTIPFSDRRVQKESSRMEMLKKDYQRNMKLAASLYGDYQDELLTREEYLQLKNSIQAVVLNWKS